jgi:hypothetical protein
MSVLELHVTYYIACVCGCAYVFAQALLCRIHKLVTLVKQSFLFVYEDLWAEYLINTISAKCSLNVCVCTYTQTTEGCVVCNRYCTTHFRTAIPSSH